MPYRTLTNNTPTIDPKLLPTQPTRLDVAPSQDGRSPTRRTTLVTALTPAEAARRTRSAHQAHIAATLQTLVTPTSQPPAPHAVFTPHDGATEKTSALDRARATVYRMHPLTVILALLATGLALCLFAATAVAGYGYFNVTDYRYSRAGLERHRISMATQLERERMDHETHLKSLALNGLIQLHDARPIAYEEGSVIDA